MHIITEDKMLEKLVLGLDLESTPGCWTWTRAKDKSGYGYVWNGNRMVRVHRASYELLVEPIPAGLVIDHTCRNTSCYNPDCLEPVTDRVNILRGEGRAARGARRTHCPNGHPYAGENLRLTSNGRRRCRTCVKAEGDRRRAAASTSRMPVGNSQSRKTHCPHGHPYGGDNLLITSAGARRCRICVKAHTDRQTAEKRVARAARRAS